jgi:hypothetical protein
MRSDKQNVTDEDLEHLKFFSTTHRSLHDQRRKVEFQVLFTTLTFSVAVSGAALTGQATLPKSLSFKALVWLLFLSVAGISSAYLRRIQLVNQRNMTIAVNAEDLIAEVLASRGFPNLVPKEFQSRKKSQSFMHRIMPNLLWQTSIVTIFALAAAVITTWS